MSGIVYQCFILEKYELFSKVYSIIPWASLIGNNEITKQKLK